LLAELLRPALLTGETLRSRSALLRKALLSRKTLLSRPAWALLAELLLLARQTLLALSSLSWSALRPGTALVALLNLWCAARRLLAELLLLAG
jgi:hypothetical protein